MDTTTITILRSDFVKLSKDVRQLLELCDQNPHLGKRDLTTLTFVIANYRWAEIQKEMQEKE